MNIVNKLTLRQMMKNKRRTLVTVIGVIISVAMVTAVAILSTSFMDILQREAIERDGNWHVQYADLNEEQVQEIQSDDQTADSFLSRDVGYAYLPESVNTEKPYVFLKQFDQKGFELYPFELTAGRLPENKNEVILTEHIEENGYVTYDIGDEITLEFGERMVSSGTAQEWGVPEGLKIDQTFSLLTDDEGNVVEEIDVHATETLTVVGFMKRPDWEPYWSPGYTIVSYADPTTVSQGNPVDLSVVMKKVKWNIYDYSEGLSTGLHIEDYTMNIELLQYHGVINNVSMFGALFVFVAIIMLIIMIGSISLIYNAFAISVSERSRHLGMLSSVGATKKQKRNSVLFEGIIIGLVSIPIGFLSGVAGMAITFYFINDSFSNALDFNEALQVVVTPVTVILSVVVSIITIFISTYIPARRASKISAIDAIRQSQDIALTKKTVKTSKLVRKLFGFEAEIGLKNLKRNKKRYIATVFSLFISIVLFLSVAYFTETLQQSLTLTQAGYNYDMEVWTNNDEFTEEHLATFNRMKQLPEVAASNILRSLELDVNIDRSHIPNTFLEDVDGNFTYGDHVPYSLTFHVLEEDLLKEYAEKAGIDMETLRKKDEANVIIIGKMSMLDEEESIFREEETLIADVGERVELMGYDYDTETYNSIGELTVVGITDENPIGILSQRWYAGVDVLMAEEALESIDYVTDDYWGDGRYRLYLSSSDPVKTGDELGEMKMPNMHVYNNYMENQKEEQLTFVMSVFIYGFIILITLISVANIFNTISTSIALRKREFGMLKSVGMTPKGFNKMIRYESIFYGLKSLLYGLPISIGFMYLMHRALSEGFSFPFSLPWMHIGIVIFAVFLIVSVSMMYSSAKVKKENIIDALKQENM